MKKNFHTLSMALLLWSAVSCSSKEENLTFEKFQVTQPIQTNTSYFSEYVGDIQSIQNVEIRSRLSGYLEQILVDEGDLVRSGQVLFTVNSSIFQQELQSAKAALNSARSELKSAELELANIRSLHGKSIVSDTELALAEAKTEGLKASTEEAEAAVQLAQLTLSFAQIKAPFDGIINRIPFKKGSLVEEGTLLTSISNNREMFVYFNVSERDYLNLAMDGRGTKGQEVSLILANGTLYPQMGKIETVESEFDPSTGNIAFRARFPNPNQLLRHGGSGKIMLTTILTNAMLIPQKATFEIQGNVYVFEVTTDGTVKQRQITPTARLPHLYVIEPTLSTSDKIIYEGIQRVKDGDMVQTETISFSDITNSKN